MPGPADYTYQMQERVRSQSHDQQTLHTKCRIRSAHNAMSSRLKCHFHMALPDTDAHKVT